MEIVSDVPREKAGWTSDSAIVCIRQHQGIQADGIQEEVI
jgi:hypothetical protein